MKERIRTPLERARELYNAGAMVLDVTASSSYPRRKVQIEGAVRVAPDRLGAHLDDLPSDRILLTY